MTAPDSPVQVTVGSAVDLQLADAEVVLRAGWGTREGRFGKRDEASRPGPMSIDVARDRTIFLLDQVNLRVQRFSADGRYLSSIAIDSPATEDIAVGGERLWTLVYEQGAVPGYRVGLYDRGRPSGRARLDRSIQLATGLFLEGNADTPDIWVEQRHDATALVARRGALLPARSQRKRALGRPDRGNPGERLTARKTGPHSAIVIRVRPEGARKALSVKTELPLLSIHELASDESGRVYLGLLVGREAGPPDHGLEQVRRLMVVFDELRKRARLVELATESVTDCFRPIAVGHDGAIYQLQTTELGLTLRRWVLGDGGDR